MKDKLFLVFHGRFPSEKAAALFVAKSAEAFAEKTCEVILLVPRRFGRASKPAREFYGLKNNFKIVFLPTIDFFPFPVLRKLAFYISYISFSIITFIYLILRAKRHDTIYSNEALPVLLASFILPKTVYEIHDFPKENFFYRKIFSKVSKFVVTNVWKSEKLQKIFSVSRDRIIAEQNAVSLLDFKTTLSTLEARSTLKLSIDATIITYVGSLRTMGMEKGIEVALEALLLLPEKVKLLLVGGSPEDVLFYSKKAKQLEIINRVIFTGFVPHEKVPLYLSASDVLIAPFPKNDHYEFYMSPMKIFEYMASGRPIVASNLQSIREILLGDSAVFVLPGNVKSLAEGVVGLLDNGDEASIKIANAMKVVQNHSWEGRAKRILDFILH
ncbi:MAG: glycosyltransferase [Candidatus Taylorbacteria bacterium]|nr:glycosyltransferase [Candidatus Taylorbacteria bacterium]